MSADDEDAADQREHESAQKGRTGRRPRTIQESSPTKTGVRLPSSVAIAACVFISAVFHSARSSAKKTPPATAIHRADARQIDW